MKHHPEITAHNRRLAGLLQAVARRDHTALKTLYELSSGRLYGVALRLVREPALADEVLEEVYVHVWRHAAACAPGLAEPMTWLAGIAYHKARDRMRKSKQPQQPLRAHCR